MKWKLRGAIAILVALVVFPATAAFAAKCQYPNGKLMTLYQRNYCKRHKLPICANSGTVVVRDGKMFKCVPSLALRR